MLQALNFLYFSRNNIILNFSDFWVTCSLKYCLIKEQHKQSLFHVVLSITQYFVILPKYFLKISSLV